MNWQDIKLSSDNKSFSYKGKPLFNRVFLDALKFHAPGLAAVQDQSGCYHIDSSGNELYGVRYTRSFGYYCNRAAVVQGSSHFHINEMGVRVYSNNYAWTGNYQENLCPVRNNENKYFHIDIHGERIYSSTFVYAGDFKDGIACVKIAGGKLRHIDTNGDFINEKEFVDLGIFHKNFATAKDDKGWHHINKFGEAIYSQRYFGIEPFYNGFAVVEDFSHQKSIVDEKGTIILKL